MSAPGGRPQLPADAASRLPTFFISHGGGPCFDMEWPGVNPFAGLRRYLAGFAASLGHRPRAIVVISAHWRAARPTITANANPALIYDYSGFPPHTYTLRYDVPGAPALAEHIRDLLDAAGIAAELDVERGLDHGVFVPFRVMYPQADIPLVQLSLAAGYDPARHLAIGAALAPLRSDGVLIVGSGMSFHDLRTIFDGRSEDAERFDTWLVDAVTGDPARRAALLTHWSTAPSARAAHPQEEHLAPLFVAAGAAAGEPAAAVYRDRIFNKPISGFRFGSIPLNERDRPIVDRLENGDGF